MADLTVFFSNNGLTREEKGCEHTFFIVWFCIIDAGNSPLRHKKTCVKQVDRIIPYQPIKVKGLALSKAEGYTQSICSNNLILRVKESF